MTESDTYFAPISPAANTQGGPQAGAKPVTLLELLQRGKQAQKQPSQGDIPPIIKNMGTLRKI